jgi:hypothetical protein
MGSYFSKQVEPVEPVEQHQPIDQVMIDNLNTADQIISDIEIADQLQTKLN